MRSPIHISTVYQSPSILIRLTCPRFWRTVFTYLLLELVTAMGDEYGGLLLSATVINVLCSVSLTWTPIHVCVSLS